MLTAENPSSDTYSFNGYTVECSASSLYGSSYPARYAFINTHNAWAPSKGSTNQYATIKFSIEVNVKLVKIENYIRIVSEINVDELIPKINCFKYKNDGAYLFDDQIKELTEEYDFRQEFQKGESFTRIFCNKENDEIKIVL